MQNKGAIWLFAILLALACLFSISFSFVTASFEKKAEQEAEFMLDSVKTLSTTGLNVLNEDSLREVFKTGFLTKNANTPVYPVFGYTYLESKSKQINQGLDLAGGMSVTLEVSIPDLIINLSNDANNPQLQEAIREAKRLQRDSQDDFVTLFGKAWQSKYPDAKMANVFHNRDNKERFPRESSNDEVLNILQEEAKVAISNTEKILRTRIDKFGVTQPTIQKQQFSGRILVELPGVKDKERVRKQLKSTANLEFWNTYENAEVITYLDQANTALSAFYFPETTLEAQDTLTAAADTTVVTAAEDGVENMSADTTVDAEAELLGLNDTTDADQEIDNDAELAEQLKRIPLFSKLQPNLTETGSAAPGPVVGYAQLGDTAAINAMLRERVVRNILPRELRLLWSAIPDARFNNLMRLYAIKNDTKDGKAPLDGSVIVDASQQYDMAGQVEVNMLMNSDGAREWKEITKAAAGENPKRSVAVVLDDYVYTAPTVQSEIAGGRSSISIGTGTRNEQIEEANDLANLLKAGALPAPANIVDESVVGPSLGQKNIEDGLTSFLIALLVVFAYMIIYYRGAGLVSDIALIANLFFLVGALASLQAALTLPGIAGIVLTIGMAVDANVLIFERIREELRQGKSVKAAVKDGYSMAYSSIIDANITTLLTAIVLLILGSGPIKGFATTLIIGIFTSLFCAIFITRLIFDARLEKGKVLSFANSWSKDILTNTKIQFIKKRKLAYFFSGALILTSFISFSVRQLNFGVDFTGGRSFTVRFDQPAELDNIRNVLATSFIDENGNKLQPEVKTFGSSNQVKITTKYLVDDESQEADSNVESALASGLDQLNDPYAILESRKVDPSISDDFQATSTSAVLFSLLIIFAYIVFRFRKWQYGVGATVALFHDVIVVLGLYSLLYGFLPFSLEIDQAFIAAILTVVGYSINDTVIVFDRIREYLKDHRKDSMAFVVNKALNSTLSRTINTSLTTFVVLLVIFIFGGESIRGFVFALMLGVIVGTYSSLFIAAPILVDLTDRTGTSLDEGLAESELV